MASNPDEPVDKVPTNFIIKVYETKALAETGNAVDALYVFENGIDAGDDTTDPRVSNGSQFLFGTTDSVGQSAGDILLDSNTNTRFSSRLNGKKITIDGNITTITGVAADGTGLIVAAGGGNNKSYHIHSPGHFFIFQKYYYRIEATDPVSGFIVDWDDGEDNSPEKANREIIKLESPRYYAVTDHIYTTHGVHYPMVRTISPEGYYSKWYVSYDARNFLSSIESQTLGEGQNEFSIVSLDLEQTADEPVLARIPEFAPANMPPIGILKVDRTSIYSGIDNAVIVNTDDEDKGYCIVQPRSAAGVVDFTNGVEVIYRTTTDRIIKETLSPKEQGETTPAAAIFPSDTGLNGFLKEVLSVKIVKLLETSTNTVYGQLMADERVHVLRYNSNGNTPNHIGNDVITSVSLGNPIQTLDRAGFFVTADGSQSQTRASNVSINKYWFEDGKMSGTIRQEPVALGQSDYFGFSVDDFDQTESNLVISYTFNHTNEGSVQDPNTKRYYDEERLIRLQVEDSSATTRNDGTTYYVGGALLSGKTITNDIGTAGVDLTVTSGHALLVGDVISPEASGTRELMQVIALNSSTSIKVKRAIQETVAEDYDGSGSALPIYLLGDNGRQGDSLTRSFIEHWEPSIYADDINRPASLLTRGLLLYANPATVVVGPPASADLGTELWRNAAPENNNNSWTGSAVPTGEPHLVFGGSLATSLATAPNRVQLSAGGTLGHTKHPTNFLLCCKTDKFNKLYFDIENRNNSESDPYNLSVNLTIWYTAKVSKSSATTTYKWKPLSFVDGTSSGGANTSLRFAGTVAFDLPEDWVAVKASDVSSGAPVRFDDEVDTVMPLLSWTENMYGLMIGIAIDGAGVGVGGHLFLDKLKCKTVLPYNNSHSQIIRLVDAHHKSLNDVAIAQSISWSRKGKFIEITDRLGRTEIRKIGVAGGTIKFGGVELSGDYTTTKGALLRYQREGTPVYLDVSRANGDFVRIFGVIISMSEDYPTGKQHPKFGIQMQTEYIIEYDSTGAWITDGIMSLGGEIIDEPKYLL